MEKRTLKNDILMLTTIGLLVALAIIFRSLLAITPVPAIRIAFDFLPIALIGMKYGSLHAGAAFMMVDLIAHWIFPRGTFFPGFTITAFMAGLSYGFFLHKKPTSVLGAVTAATIVVVGIQWGIDTLWLSIIQEVPYTTLFVTRAVRTAIMLPLQIASILIVAQVAKRAKLI